MFSAAWQIASGPTWSYNHEGSSGNKWTVPFGGGVERVFRIGKQAINSNIGAFYNVERPQFGPNWQVRFQFNFLFPK